MLIRRANIDRIAEVRRCPPFLKIFSLGKRIFEIDGAKVPAITHGYLESTSRRGSRCNGGASPETPSPTLKSLENGASFIATDRPVEVAFKGENPSPRDDVECVFLFSKLFENLWERERGDESRSHHSRPKV